MSILKYFKQLFPHHLMRLEFKKPSRVVSHNIMKDPSVIFFGGKNWENVKSDLNKIPIKERESFVLCLFMIVLTDQCIRAHFNEIYSKWRGMTNFPKFGWSGFGPHHENPMKILWIPEKGKMIDIKKVIDIVPDFAKMFAQEVNGYINTNFFNLDHLKFLEAISQDPEFQFNEGQVASVVRKHLQNV